MRSTEQPSSNVAAIRAAISGATTGTLYSSANSWTVSSQLAILVSPAFTNTLATARRNSTWTIDRKSTRLNSSHGYISYAVFCLKKKKRRMHHHHLDPQLRVTPHR